MWQRLKKLLGQVQHHCRICVCLRELNVNFVKRFSFVFKAVTVHEGQSMAEGGAVPYSLHKLEGEHQLQCCGSPLLWLGSCMCSA